MCLWEFVNDRNLYGNTNTEIVLTCDCDGYKHIVCRILREDEIRMGI